jgi:hypothetical protein
MAERGFQSAGYIRSSCAFSLSVNGKIRGRSERKAAGRQSAGAPAHQHRRIAVVAEPDGVAELVDDDVASDVRKVQRRPVGILDADHALAGSVKRARERHEVGIGQQDREVSGQVAQGLGNVNRARTAEDRLTERLQRYLGNRAGNPLDRT